MYSIRIMSTPKPKAVLSNIQRNDDDFESDEDFQSDEPRYPDNELINGSFKFDQYDLDRIRDMENADIEDFEPINKEKYDEFVKILTKLIKTKQIYMMDKENMIPWRASSIIGYKGGIVIAHER